MTQLVEEIYACPDCDFKHLVWRRVGREKERLHKKWLYCVVCGDDKNFTKTEKDGDKPYEQHNFSKKN